MLRLALVCLLAAACQSATPAAQSAPAAPKAVEPAPEAAPAPEAKAAPEPEEAAAEEAAAEVAAAEGAAPAVAQPAVVEEEDFDCNVEGYVSDPDPAGLNVRADASGRAAIVGKIPFNGDGTILEVVGARNGWLQLRKARPLDGDPYEVSGWVSGQMVETMVRCPEDEPGEACTAALYAVPGEGEAERRRLPVDARVKIVGCRGRWVEAQTIEAARDQRAKGWLSPRSQCGNPVTTCP